MKLFKYNQFINESKQSKEEIDSICEKYGIEKYTINDGTVDVNGSVQLWNRGLYKIPLKFGKVTGSFNCSGNYLTSLEGCPSEVCGDFRCSGNELTSLEGGPKKVGGSYKCFKNLLTTLEGCPKEVISFDCENNLLTSLKGGPEKVSGNFDCYLNNLIDLKGSPTKVSGDFYCNDNRLSSLEGCPTKVGRNFNCSNNELVDVKYMPEVGGYIFVIMKNPVYEVLILFPSSKFKEAIEYLNDYNVIRDGNKVVLQALELVYDELGLEVPENIEIKGYEII